MSKEWLDPGPYLAWLHARLDMARALSTDKLLTALAIAVFLIVLLFIAWVRAAQRTRAAMRAIAELESDRVNLQSKLDSERKWRLAADAFQ